MDVKYFSAPKLNEALVHIKLGMLDFIGESPSVRPLAIQTTYPGLAFDFNCGMRLQIPEGNWHVRIIDHDSELVCFEDDVSDVILISAEKFFVRWEFFLWLDGEFMFAHKFDAKNFRVHFNFSPSGMGDRIILFPYMEAFRKKWGCRVSCEVEPYLQELVNLYYPAVECSAAPPDSYATYFPAPGFNPIFYPDDMRTVPMEKFGQQIFGLTCAERIIYLPTKPRQISEPYVCIAVQTSSTIKSWLNPDGWSVVVDYLKRLGYRVLCIDKQVEQNGHDFTVRMPDGAENFTGDLPLSERVNLLAYAEFFIGLSSGLSWLAWAADCPAILISGITAHCFEFYTPYRVVNRLVCHGCHNDIKIPWDDFHLCPYHAGTARAYECSTKISARQVIDTIDRLLADKRAGRFAYQKFF
ncbi:MAG: autotransporter strand-loop-strand O-heptosyltransferase [Selenomonadaceae bacterium]|nr:autotransporter strand-loop-strand O-heptosyltransferase [Selenomonadaceae bacterium]